MGRFRGHCERRHRLCVLQSSWRRRQRLAHVHVGGVADDGPRRRPRHLRRGVDARVANSAVMVDGRRARPVPRQHGQRRLVLRVQGGRQCEQHEPARRQSVRVTGRAVRAGSDESPGAWREKAGPHTHTHTYRRRHAGMRRQSHNALWLGPGSNKPSNQPIAIYFKGRQADRQSPPRPRRSRTVHTHVHCSRNEHSDSELSAPTLLRLRVDVSDLHRLQCRGHCHRSQQVAAEDYF